MPSSAQLRDIALGFLHKTSVGYLNKYWRVPPAGSNWAKAEAALKQIGIYGQGTYGGN